MKTARVILLGILAIFATVVVFGAEPVVEKEYVRFDKEKKTFEANLESLPVDKVLEKVALATGWDVFMDPGLTNQPNTKFNSLSQQEGLERMLRKINYAVFPETNGVPKLFVYRTKIHQAVRRISKFRTQREKKDGPIANELLISLKAGSKETAAELAKRLGGKIVGEIKELGLYRISFADAEAAAAARTLLAGDPDIAAIDTNYIVDRPPTPETVQLSAALGAGLSLTPVNNKDGLVIGLIDTPIQAKNPAVNGFLMDPLSIFSEVQSPTTFNHADGMAETILKGIEVAGNSTTSAAKILPIDVYGNSETTSTFDVANGILMAIKNGASVVNLSLGTSADSATLAQLIDYYSKQGILFVAAAGNESTSAATYPAAYTSVLSVTASDRNGNIANYANYGSFVDVILPGTSLISYGNRAYIGTGTSYSTALASGMVAGLMGSKGVTATDAGATMTTKFGFKAK